MTFRFVELMSAIILIGFINLNCRKPDPERVFINKKYCELPPVDIQGCQKSQGFMNPETICYRRFDNGKGFLMIELWFFADAKAAKLFVINDALGNNDKSWINHNILMKRKGERLDIYWISENILNRITFEEFPFCRELLEDYLTKYPPTITLTDKDFSIDDLIQPVVKSRFEEIRFCDRYRLDAGPVIDPSRGVIIYYMKRQCRAEMVVRCLIGELDEDGYDRCHYTEIYDRSERMKAFQGLEQRARPGNFVHKNYSFRDPEAWTCPWNLKYLNHTLTAPTKMPLRRRK